MFFFMKLFKLVFDLSKFFNRLFSLGVDISDQIKYDVVKLMKNIILETIKFMNKLFEAVVRYKIVLL